jgi:hypothetical protein
MLGLCHNWRGIKSAMIKEDGHERHTCGVDCYDAEVPILA